MAEARFSITLGRHIHASKFKRCRLFSISPSMASPYGLRLGENKWVSLDPGSAVCKARFQTPESRCAPSVQRHPQRRSFSSHFHNISRSGESDAVGCHTQIFIIVPAQDEHHV